MQDDDQMPRPRLLHSADEVAEMLAISINEVRDLARNHELACVRIGRRVLFTPADIDAFIKRRRIPASA